MFEVICAELSAAYGMPHYKMRQILLAFKKAIIEAIENGEEFVLSGLFSVKYSDKKGYSRINPFTGKKITVKPRRQAKLYISKKIKYSKIEK